MPDLVIWITGACGAFLALAAVVKVVIPLFRWARNTAPRLSGALDNVGGRDAFIDHATGKTVPAIPAIGERFTSIEERLDRYTDNTVRVDTIDARLTQVESKIDGVQTTLAFMLGDKYVAGSEAALKAAELLSQTTLDGDVDA
ncbi:MAG: hypothetical protein JWP74_1772 [Marmoricola sp.]|nr:hypothetical protein [Marmoricola sp.]